jgi:hypothetical protein
MKNQKIAIIEKKEESKEIKGLNLKNLKIDLSKGDSSLLNIKKNESSRDFYKGMEGLSSDEKKKKREGLRRELKKFNADIRGLDRSNEERENAIEKFMEFYKENWKIQDFKIENFSNARNPIDKKSYIDLLSYLKSILG